MTVDSDSQATSQDAGVPRHTKPSDWAEYHLQNIEAFVSSLGMDRESIRKDYRGLEEKEGELRNKCWRAEQAIDKIVDVMQTKGVSYSQSRLDDLYDYVNEVYGQSEARVAALKWSEQNLESAHASLSAAEKELQEVAEALREQAIQTLLKTPLVDEHSTSAISERQALMRAVASELRSQQEKLVMPATEACRLLLSRLKEAGADTHLLEENLAVGDVGVVLAVERILRKMSDDLDRAQSGVNKDLMGALETLEAEVNQKVVDVRLRVVPRGLIAFARELAAEAHDPAAVKASEKAVQRIIELIRQYIGG